MTDSLPSDFMADGQPFENPEASADTAYAATTPSLGAKLGADVEDGVTAGLVRATARGRQQGASWFDRFAAMAGDATAAEAGVMPDSAPEASQTLSADEVNKRFAPPGTTVTDAPMSEGLARVVGQQKADEIKRDAVLSRYAAGHGTLTNLGVGLLGSVLDPLQAASAFVPGLGEETIAAHFGEGLIARTAARALAGASAGAAAMVPIVGLKAAEAQAENNDYGLRGAMYDMAAGVGLGALGHAGFGALREAGILKPDGLMLAEQARAAAGLRPAEAPTGLVSDADLGAVIDAPASSRFDALNAGVAQVLDGREVDVAPIFDQVRADRAEADLRLWSDQQGRLDAQTTAALQASSLSDAAAGTVESRAAVLQSRLDDLRGQQASFLADIERAEAQRAVQTDIVTPQRLQAIDAELNDSATIPAARRMDLENERALLTEGRDPATDALEAARTEAELQGLQRGAAAVQSEMDRTAANVEPLQQKAMAARAAGSDALGTVSDRIAGQEKTLRTLAARSIRRYAGAFGADITRDEADALALRTLRGGADEVAKVVAEIRGRAVPSTATAPPSVAAFAGPPIEPPRPVPQLPSRPDVAALAQRQQAIYRGGFAPGMPQAEFDALNEAVYDAKAPTADSVAGPRSDDVGAPAKGANGAEGAGPQAPKTAADALLATWQQRFDVAGVVPTSEERALIDATRARVEAADLSAKGYAQAGACLTAAGI